MSHENEYLKKIRECQDALGVYTRLYERGQLGPATNAQLDKYFKLEDEAFKIAMRISPIRETRDA